MESVSWGRLVSVTSLWRHMAKWLLHPSQACTLSYSWLHPRHILGLFHPRMRFMAESRLRLLGDTVLCSLLALCLDSSFQLFYTDHSYVSWVFLLPGQVWFTTSTDLGIKGAYRPMQAEGRGPEGHCPFLGKHVPKPSAAGPQTAPSRVVVFQASLTHLMAIVRRCLQEREHTNNLCRKIRR